MVLIIIVFISINEYETLLPAISGQTSAHTNTANIIFILLIYRKRKKMDDTQSEGVMLPNNITPEIEQNLIEDNFEQVEFFNNSLELSKKLKTAELFFKLITESNTPIFATDLNRNGKLVTQLTKVGDHLLSMRFMPTLKQVEKARVDKKSINPALRLILSWHEDLIYEVKDLSFLLKYPRNLLDNGETHQEYIERKIVELRKKAKQPKLMRELRNWKSAKTNNYQGILRMINGLFERFSKLLIIRLDLGFRKESSEHNFPHRSCKAFKKLQNNMRHNSLFKNQLAIIWKLETTPEKGFHYHVALIFDGSKSQHDINLAEGVGKYWRDVITRNEGVYYNCNNQEYINSGIGMVEYHDQPKREALLEMLTYLTKEDPYIRIVLDRLKDQEKHSLYPLSNFRTFGRTAITRPKGTKRGRPRSIRAVVARKLNFQPCLVNFAQRSMQGSRA